jgi:hypothetical protein
MTTSTEPLGNLETDSAARSWRRIRFRVTAFPNEVGRAKPTRGAALVVSARAERTLDRTRTPCALSAANEERPTKRPAATMYLCAQFGAALGSTSLEHTTATGRSHAGAKAVLLSTTTIVWLERTLHR